MGKRYTYVAFLRRPTDGDCRHYDIEVDEHELEFVDFPLLVEKLHKNISDSTGYTLIGLNCTDCVEI